MSEKKIYKIVVVSTFYEPIKNKAGSVKRREKRTRHQINGEIEVDTTRDAIDVLKNALHLAVKEYGERDESQTRYILSACSKCPCCGKLQDPKTLLIGNYDGEFFTTTIYGSDSKRKHYGSVESMYITAVDSLCDLT